MKITTLLFALYLFALACYPCADEDTCLDEKKNGVEITDVTRHDHSSSETDHCSPLCTCSCCAATVQLSLTGVVIPANISHDTKFFIPRSTENLLSCIHAIWQPPRLA